MIPEDEVFREGWRGWPEEIPGGETREDGLMQTLGDQVGAIADFMR